jgi:hypothetical protein
VTRYRIWILKLVPGFPYAGFLSATLIFLLLYPLFRLGAAESNEASTPALFFSLIIAYIIPVFSFITARAEEALAELIPLLPADSATLRSARDRLHTVSPRTLLLLLLGGALLGLAHISFIRGSFAEMFSKMLNDIPSFISTLGTVLVWVVMTTVVFMLVQQAVWFARLGAEVRISLLNTRTLLAFGRVAIYSSLAVIGALALFPLMGVDSTLVMAEGLPAVIATAGPLLGLFILPVWPVHRRLSALKTRESAALVSRIEACLGDGDGSELSMEKMAELTPLLAYRQEIARISTWPFDVGSVTRLILYLVIVPLTWAGAALIERLVDLFVQ